MGADGRGVPELCTGGGRTPGDTLTQGERWVRDALTDLRTGRSLTGFLSASLERAAATRRRRPELARQARAWSAAGLLAWTLPPVRSEARAGVAWWLAVSVMLDWHLGMVETEEGEPRMLGPADACTLLRAWLVPLAFRDARPSVLAVGFATDAADGALARHSAPTRAGRQLEGVVDAAFAAAALRGTVRAGRLGRVPAAAEASRLTVGAAHSCCAYLLAGRPPSASVARAARPTAPLRAAGLLTAAAGHRRAGGVLLGLGALGGAAASAASARATGGARS